MKHSPVALTDRQLIELAREHLSTELFRVWILKYHGQLGRRSGSLALGITEEAWRYRLRKAEQLMAKALKEAA